MDDLFRLYEGRVPAFADLVCYWFEKARAQIEAGNAQRAGLLATNSIRGGANREVLKRIKDSGDIFMAWSDQPWILEGAAVRVSIVGFEGKSDPESAPVGGTMHRAPTPESPVLDGQPVTSINADLTALVDVATAVPLTENAQLAFRGNQKGGAFDISAKTAAEMFTAINSSGRSNRDVIVPWWNGLDITGRPRNMWLIDFGVSMPFEEAELYESPIAHVRSFVKPERDKNPVKNEREHWWLSLRPRPEMRAALAKLPRYLATPHVSKHRLVVWMDKTILPDHQLIAIARSDNYFFGVLHSFVHEWWSLRMGTSLEDRPRYTPTTTFETFPFPWPPGHEDTASPHYAAISAAAAALHAERDAWLNPPGVSDEAALRDRTLTALYNALAAHRTSPPGPLSARIEGESAAAFAPRLAALHDALDRAVLDAYGWGDLFGTLRTPTGKDELLRRLLALNGERAQRG